MTTILLASLIMSFVCFAVSISMDEGMFLYPLKKPYNDYVNKVKSEYERQKNNIVLNKIDDVELRNILLNDAKEEYLRSINKYWYLKPIVGCVICFASFYGSLTFCLLSLCGYIEFYNIIFCLPICVFLNFTFDEIFSFLEKK